MNKTFLRIVRIAPQVIFAIVLPNAGGFVGSVVTAKSLNPWHAELIKPDYNPPNWLFAPVWIILYTLMGIASFLVWQSGGGFKGFEDPVFKSGITFYMVSLILNWIWTPLFFGDHNLLWVSSPSVGGNFWHLTSNFVALLFAELYGSLFACRCGVCLRDCVLQTE